MKDLKSNVLLMIDINTGVLGLSLFLQVSLNDQLINILIV